MREAWLECDKMCAKEWWSVLGGEFGSLFICTELGEGEDVAGDVFGTPKCKEL